MATGTIHSPTRELRGLQLYHERVGTAVPHADARNLLESWRAEPAARVVAEEHGFVRRIAATDLMCALQDCGAERVALLPRPGDFVAIGTPLAVRFALAWSPRPSPQPRYGRESSSGARDSQREIWQPSERESVASTRRPATLPVTRARCGPP